MEIEARLGNGASTPLEAAAKSALSRIRGTIALSGLTKPVTVLRDSWGVPHIYAQNEHDLFFAQGFVAAQDRLFQMELWKRVGQGRLAEVFGPSYVQRDISARLLAYRGSMADEYASYAPDAEEILKAFTEGINAEIALRMAPGGPGLPLEFRLAGFEPEPWKPEDCLTRMAGFPMTRNAVEELFHAKLVTLLGREKASALLDLDPPVLLDPAPGTDLAGLDPALLRNLQGSDSDMFFPADLAKSVGLSEEDGSSKWDSNNWVVSGKLTASQRPLLCNDPHRTVDKAPSLRYVVHLVAPGWNVIGATEPGSPGVEGGHNEHIAWGWTIFGMDQQDLYIETLDPNDRLRYKTDKGWSRMNVQKATIRVRGQNDITVELKFTRHGPVLWEDAPTHRALALRWIGAEPGTAGYLACLTLDRAKNWEDFEQAVRRWKVPTENIVYADAQGNIGEYSAGMGPIRRNFTGTIPEPGQGGFEWAGWVPTEALPHQHNPASGFVVTANQRMIPEDFPYKVGNEWAEPYRADRITEVLRGLADGGHKITREDMERLQADVVSLPARHLIALLAPASRDANSAAQLLVNWNGEVDRDSRAAALYELWQIEIEKEMLHRLAPENAWGTLENRLPFSVVLRHLENPDEATFGREPEQGRDELLREALAAATRRMNELEGSNASAWSWGKLHTVTFHHVLELVPGGKSLFDIGPFPRPGDSFTVNNTYFGPHSFDQLAGPSYREIIDVGNWDDSEVVNAPGESGQPGSPHYSDLIPLWDQGRYFPMLYSKKAVEEQTKDRLILEPKANH